MGILQVGCVLQKACFKFFFKMKSFGFSPLFQFLCFNRLSICKLGLEESEKFPGTSSKQNSFLIYRYVSSYSIQTVKVLG